MGGSGQTRRMFLSTVAAGLGLISTGPAEPPIDSPTTGTASGATGVSNDANTKLPKPPNQTPKSGLSRAQSTRLDGESGAFEVHVVESGRQGPTAFVVGGMHGDEEAGYIAASEIPSWTIDAGTLVVVPKANTVGIERKTRGGAHGDLNRKFPYGEEPKTEVARALWETVIEAEPDVVVDMHEARGIYNASGSVGQAVFHSPSETARETAAAVVKYTNERYMEDDTYAFSIGNITSPSVAPSGLLTEKTAYQLELPSYIVETYEELDLEKRVQWQKTIVARLLLSAGLVEPQ